MEKLDPNKSIGLPTKYKASNYFIYDTNVSKNDVRKACNIYTDFKNNLKDCSNIYFLELVHCDFKKRINKDINWKSKTSLTKLNSILMAMYREKKEELKRNSFEFKKKD